MPTETSPGDLYRRWLVARTIVTFAGKVFMLMTECRWERLVMTYQGSGWYSFNLDRIIDIGH